MPHGFKEESFLGIDQLCLFRGDMEKECIKLIHIIHEPAPFRVDLSFLGLISIRVEKGMIIPSASRYFADTVFSGF